jgi:D-alanine--poly(phosphoribitol) ligase subunit 1
MGTVNQIFIQRFWENCEKFKDRNCIYIWGKYYSYGTFAYKVLAAYKNIDSFQGDKSRIGVLSYNDVDTYASVLAIFSYGASYVPVNNKFPLLRNKNLLSKAGVKVILSSEENEDVESYYRYSGIETITIEENNEAAEFFIPERKIIQEEAYLMFTSGSTGEPKGVPASSYNIEHFLSFMCDSGSYDFNEKDRFLQMFDLTFDASLMCILIPLLKGACFYVPEDGPVYAKAIELIEHKNLTVSLMVPSILEYLKNYLAEINLPSLKYSFFGGERLSAEMAKKWMNCVPKAIVENLYGPTEATIWCSHFRLDRNSIADLQGIVPIGKLFSDMDFMLIDENKNEMFDKGELYLTGAQVISNYLNSENPESFIVKNNKTYYRTGDVVSLYAEDNLSFIGRLDNQVKINGYRVNLEEIEQTINQISKSACAVIMIEGEDSIFLRAYIRNFDDVDFLLENLKKSLPFYMIPEDFVSVNELPINSNGKIDRKKLVMI